VSVRLVLRTLGSVALAVMVTLAMPGPASAAREELPHVVLTVAFDHDFYTGQAPVTLLFTFTNDGPVTAHNVHDFGGDIEGFTLGATPEHFDLAPGETHTGTATGAIDAGGVKLGIITYVKEYETDDGDPLVHSNAAIAKAGVLGAFGDARGVVYDVAGPNPPDEIGIPCVTLIWTNELKPGVEVARATTDAKGHYQVTHLPAGQYPITFILPSGYKLTVEDPPPADQIRSDLVADSQIALTRTDGPVVCPPSSPSAPPLAAPVLPTTGSSTLRIGAAGLGVLLLGLALVLVFRRRRAAA
jgi:LPXTG-motif cell wall-anchored protein